MQVHSQSLGVLVSLNNVLMHLRRHLKETLSCNVLCFWRAEVVGLHLSWFHFYCGIDLVAFRALCFDIPWRYSVTVRSAIHTLPRTRTFFEVDIFSKQSRFQALQVWCIRVYSKFGVQTCRTAPKFFCFSFSEVDILRWLAVFVTFLAFSICSFFFAFSVLLLSSLSRSLRCWASAVGYILMNAHRVSAQFNVCCGQGEKQRKACKELQR